MSIKPTDSSIPQAMIPSPHFLYALTRANASMPPDGVGPFTDPQEQLLANLAAADKGQRPSIFDEGVTRLGFDLALTRAAMMAADPMAPPPPPIRRTLWRASDLLAAELADPVWVISQMLTEGLTMFAGRPKVRKSWLMLQVAYAVGSGGKFFGIQVEQGKVLYFALEDSERRLQSRMTAQRWSSQVDPEVIFETEIPSGGIAYIIDRINEEQPRLVIIDTYSRVVGKIDQNDVSAVTEALSILQRAALINKCAVVIVDHLRKGEGDDWMARILGSTGKTATADSIWSLGRKQGSQSAELNITGRDVMETKLDLDWDEDRCQWLSNGPAVLKLPDKQLEVLHILLESKEASTSDIERQTGMNKSQVSRLLAELVNKGLASRGSVTGRVRPYFPTLAAHTYRVNTINSGDHSNVINSVNGLWGDE